MPDLKVVTQEADISKKVDLLKKGRITELPPVAQYLKEWNPKEHLIFDKTERPDKTIYADALDDNGNPIEGKSTTRIEKVARVAAAFQKLIVRRAAAFLFGNPVKVVCEEPDNEVATAVQKILTANKQKGLNKRVARTLFASTEVAEYWYPVKAKKEFKTYGFPTDMKIKCAIFSPLKGDKLYPFFDQYGSMVAFSREYTLKEDDKDVIYFETWTDEKYTRYKQVDSTWTNALETDSLDLNLGKIPIVYGCQEEVEWKDVQWMIERFEKLISNFGDTNDYHGSPKIKVTGEVAGFSKKGDSGGILQLQGEGADAEYLSWEQSAESIKLEIENLMRLIFAITQTPDISFEALKGLGNAPSGNSFEMLFLDAHLKVMDHLEVFDDYLERRFNILKTFVGKLNTKLETTAEETELLPEVTPFMVNDVKDAIENLVTAVSGKIISRKTAVSLNPLVKDTDAEITQLDAEREQEDASALALNNAQNDPIDDPADPVGE